jgi:hypothetical protein
MDDVSRIRDRATRLFVLAIQARDEGHASAETLTKLAHEALAHADELSGRRPGQQQQQPQPDKEE